MFVKSPRLSTAEIIDRYMSGESLTMIALKSKVANPHIRQILLDAGVTLRGMDEARRLGLLDRYRRGKGRAV